jgi:hypothetical protein
VVSQKRNLIKGKPISLLQKVKAITCEAQLSS